MKTTNYQTNLHDIWDHETLWVAPPTITGAMSTPRGGSFYLITQQLKLHFMMRHTTTLNLPNII